MKKLILLFVITFSSFTGAQVPAVNRWVLDAIEEMPSKGGYVLNAVAPKKMRDAFTWDLSHLDQLNLNSSSALPSYCTTATYLVFYKTLQKYWSLSGKYPSRETLALLKPNLENDGTRIWGRWNSNGPGTAKFFHDAQLGENFDELDQAIAGDFMKIYWNDQVGKKEKGHSVVFLGKEVKNGVTMIRFWSSNASTDGYGEKLIPRSDAVRFVFSRLTAPEMIDSILNIDVTDAFLASMLVRESSWAELRSVSGID